MPVHSRFLLSIKRVLGLVLPLWWSPSGNDRAKDHERGYKDGEKQHYEKRCEGGTLGRAPQLVQFFPLGSGAAATGSSQLSIAAAGEPCGRHIEDTSQYEPRIPQHQVPEEPFPRRWVIDDPRHVQAIRDQAEAAIQAEADTANPGSSQHQPMDPAVLPGARQRQRQQAAADLEDAGGQVGDEPHLCWLLSPSDHILTVGFTPIRLLSLTHPLLELEYPQIDSIPCPRSP